MSDWAEDFKSLVNADGRCTAGCHGQKICGVQCVDDLGQREQGKTFTGRGGWTRARTFLLGL